jgi:hypothetical protein
LIAISVEKVFGLDQSFQDVSAEQNIEDFTFNIASELNQRLAKYQRIWVDTRIVGVIAIIRYIARMPNTVVSSYTTAILSIALPEFGQKSDNNRLIRLTEHLRLHLRGKRV